METDPEGISGTSGWGELSSLNVPPALLVHWKCEKRCSNSWFPEALFSVKRFPSDVDHTVEIKRYWTSFLQSLIIVRQVGPDGSWSSNGQEGTRLSTSTPKVLKPVFVTSRQGWGSGGSLYLFEGSLELPDPVMGEAQILHPYFFNKKQEIQNLRLWNWVPNTHIWLWIATVTL